MLLNKLGGVLELKKLIRLANHLDSNGLYKEADDIDDVIKKLAYINTSQIRFQKNDIPDGIIKYLISQNQDYDTYDIYVENSKLYSDYFGLPFSPTTGPVGGRGAVEIPASLNQYYSPEDFKVLLGKITSLTDDQRKEITGSFTSSESDGINIIKSGENSDYIIFQPVRGENLGSEKYVVYKNKLDGNYYKVKAEDNSIYTLYKKEIEDTQDNLKKMLAMYKNRAAQDKWTKLHEEILTRLNNLAEVEIISGQIESPEASTSRAIRRDDSSYIFIPKDTTYAYKRNSDGTFTPYYISNGQEAKNNGQPISITREQMMTAGAIPEQLGDVSEAVARPEETPPAAPEEKPAAAPVETPPAPVEKVTPPGSYTVLEKRDMGSNRSVGIIDLDPQDTMKYQDLKKRFKLGLSTSGPNGPFGIARKGSLTEPEKSYLVEVRKRITSQTRMNRRGGERRRLLGRIGRRRRSV